MKRFVYPNRFLVAALTSIVFLTACNKHAVRTVYFGNLTDGENVESPFKVEMKSENLIVEPATAGITDGHGHFHIIINSPMPPATSPIPKDAMHIHYGQGDTETVLNLPVGEYNLLLQFAQGNHMPYDPQIVSNVIHVNVTKQNVPQSIKTDTARTTDTIRTVDMVVPQKPKQ